MQNIFGRFVVLGLVSLALGCSEVQLYTNLPEKEVNEMMAILMDHQIACTKVAGEEGMWNITVSQSGYSDAVTILSDLGRPRKQRPTMEELFPKTGFTSSPSEQRIRLTYGLAESLEETIATLPGGVVDASVHLVLPENNPFGESAKVSRANVVVIHRRGGDITNAIPTIKSIIIGGVDGLDADNVSVDLIEADESLSQIRARQGNGPQSAELTSFLSMKVSKDSTNMLIGLLAVSAICFIIGISLTTSSLMKRRPSSRGA
ncbi:EscJ/YscJ/HrcJ family type III secretion inner membrane ring protein [bacterium]|nr:EscJ/YscJ/HrcJ family type III secretion inner membrane ring protein [bacterium]